MGQFAVGDNMLDHPFCKDVHDAITALASTVLPEATLGPLFRGRVDTKGVVESVIDAFDFPPAEIVKEGRYNHAGGPALYVASDLDTCHAELRNLPSLVLEFRFNKELRILDLIDLPYNDVGYTNLLSCLKYSALISARQPDNGFDRPHYIVSRFVADCAKAAGLDAIKYPSTRRTASNFNMAILNPTLALANNAVAIRYHRTNTMTSRPFDGRTADLSIF